jgi:multiple antibiotic resistance protein
LDNIFITIGIAFASLFPVINPLGAIPVFCSLTSDNTDEYRKKMALKTSVNVFFILIVFFFIGELLLDFFGISLGVLKIAGGLIVAHTAWEMVSGHHKLSHEENTEVETKEDISFTPMALPLLSGPGAIGVVIGLSYTNQNHLIFYSGTSIGILLIAISAFISLRLSMPLFKLLGKTGVGVLNRIMGFFILAIAVQLVFNGIFSLTNP